MIFLINNGLFSSLLFAIKNIHSDRRSIAIVIAMFMPGD